MPAKLTAACGAFFFRYRNLAFPLVLVLLVWTLPPRYAGGSRAADLWLDGLGLLVLLAGQALRAAVIGFAYIKRGGLNKRVHADRLVTTGFFGVCRNPLYLGNFLILAGLLTVHHNPAAYLLGLGFFGLAYASIVQVEEAFLRARFGADYDAYCQAVPRWWPDLRRLPAATAGMRFDWRKALTKDYGTAVTWLLALAALWPYEALAMGEAALAGARALLAVAALALLLPAALAIRWAKKSGRLLPRTI
jgi:protein-S-isoprenylcysteine O-methyltransferase Ste14